MAAVAAAPILRRNDPAIDQMHIYLRLENDAELARAIEQNEHVTKIFLDLTGTRAGEDWGSLLRVIATREKLEYIAFMDHQNPQFRRHEAAWTTVFHAIRRNTSILQFDLFNVKLSGAVLSSYLDDVPSNMEAFGMWHCDILPAEATLVAAALRRCTPLEHLSLVGLNENVLLTCLQSLASNDTLTALVLAFGASANYSGLFDALEKVEIETICFMQQEWTEEFFSQLTSRIPQFQATDLLVSLSSRYNRGDLAEAKDVFLAAVKRNFSLRTVSFEYKWAGMALSETLFDDADENRLAFYAERNERFAKWVENPASVPRHLWPEALRLALEAGNTPLWRSLQSVAPEVGDLQRKRKRKRPRYYDPS